MKVRLQRLAVKAVLTPVPAPTTVIPSSAYDDYVKLQPIPTFGKESPYRMMPRLWVASGSNVLTGPQYLLSCPRLW